MNDSSPVQLLCIDDDPVALQILGMYIERLGGVPILTSSGPSALKLLADPTNTFAGVLLDISMPEMDGYEVARWIRSNLSLNSMPIIAVTARCEDAIYDEAPHIGLNAIISKPYKLNDVIAALTDCGIFAHSV